MDRVFFRSGSHSHGNTFRNDTHSLGWIRFYNFRQGIEFDRTHGFRWIKIVFWIDAEFIQIEKVALIDYVYVWIEVGVDEQIKTDWIRVFWFVLGFIRIKSKLNARVKADWNCESDFFRSRSHSRRNRFRINTKKYATA